MITLLLLLQAAAASASAAPPAGYPTTARAEYVIACMGANGQTPEMLQRCSCSIDVIASLVPYDDYVTAETVMAMRGTGGERASMINDAQIFRAAVQRLREAQVEADLRCF